MNLKKAKEMLRWITSLRSQDHFVYLGDLKRILEALAESDEGEKPSRILEKRCRACGFPNWYDSCKEAEPLKCYKCTRPFATPAFTSGDLVKYKPADKLGIFQAYREDDKEECVLLDADNEGQLWRFVCNTESLELIQRGCFDVSLGRMRDKLRSKD